MYRYWGESYTQTFVWDASATFEFDGTGVTVLGGKRNFRGGYTVRLDGEEQETSDAFSVEGEYRAVLFSAHDLEQTRHRVVIRNAGMSLDIDCVRALVIPLGLCLICACRYYGRQRLGKGGWRSHHRRCWTTLTMPLHGGRRGHGRLIWRIWQGSKVPVGSTLTNRDFSNT